MRSITPLQSMDGRLSSDCSQIYYWNAKKPQDRCFRMVSVVERTPVGSGLGLGVFVLSQSSFATNSQAHRLKKEVLRCYSSLPRYAFSKLCKHFFPPRGTVFPNICPDNKTIRKSNTDFMRPGRSRLISNRKKAEGTKHPPQVPSPCSLEFLYYKTLETFCVPVHKTLI